ncbi:hypothetical protein BASA61_005551 [Batrachochytrium salamandrivorans]|nr:hypothetical protein BASA61_005551 [Batrachochytrium salamandrivorans]
MLRSTPKAAWNSSTKLPRAKVTKSAVGVTTGVSETSNSAIESSHSVHHPVIAPTPASKRSQSQLQSSPSNVQQRASTTAPIRRPLSVSKARATGSSSMVSSSGLAAHTATVSATEGVSHARLGSKSAQLKPSRQDSVISEYSQILASKNTSDREMRESLRRLRHLVLTEGIPDTGRENNGHGCDLRGRVWKALMGIYRISALEYATLVQRGLCTVAEKIQNDTFRTLMTDKSFQGRVTNDMLTRILNAFVWKAHDQPPSRLINLRFSYVQGMNVIAAPFLYVFPELDAFVAFTSFIQNSCPLYVQPALEGVHCGIKLLDRCLEEIDNELYEHLKSKQMTAAVYAFPSIMTFSACTPPLDQVLHLWDFFLAYGVHLNILCIVSQLLHIKRELMATSSPTKLLRSFPDLSAGIIIETAKDLISQIPEDLYDMLVRHTFDPIVCDMLLQGNEDEVAI